jgi:hypothetical protein
MSLEVDLEFCVMYVRTYMCTQTSIYAHIRWRARCMYHYKSASICRSECHGILKRHEYLHVCT